MKKITVDWSNDYNKELSWKTKKVEEKFKASIFSIDRISLQHPVNKSISNFYQLDSSDWVNVFALTAAKELVVIEQFRFGSLEITLETPGGFVEPGESPENSAKRELLEETGFASEKFIHLNSISPNPAFNKNEMHFYLALNARENQKQDPDPNEIIHVGLIDLEDFETLVHTGKVTHALVVAGFSFLKNYLDRKKI